MQSAGKQVSSLVLEKLARLAEQTRLPLKKELASCRDELFQHYFKHNTEQMKKVIQPYRSEHGEIEKNLDYYLSQVAEIYFYLKRKNISLTSEHYKCLRKFAFGREFGMAYRAPWYTYLQSAHSSFYGQPIEDTPPPSILNEREELAAVQCISIGAELIYHMLLAIRHGGLDLDQISRLMHLVHQFADAQNMRMLPSYERKIERKAVSGKQAEKRRVVGQKTRGKIAEALDDVLEKPWEREAFYHANGRFNVSRLWQKIKSDHPEIEIGPDRGRRILSELIEERSIN